MKSERISPFWVNGYQPFSAGYTNKNIYTLEVGDNNDYFICMLNGRKHFVVEHINHKISEEDFLKKIKNIH